MTDLKFLPTFALLLLGTFFLTACNKQMDEFILNGFEAKLSAYGIYQGNPSELIPAPDYELYELSSALFTDHAEKQRLIKLPPGTSMSALDQGLFDFPEGTIIVKTFYYFLDKGMPLRGTNIIETRVLEKVEGIWKVGTYKWNESQTDADLISSGSDQTVNWVDESGKFNSIYYHIPSNAECRSCHLSASQVVPIGPKVRNLNFEVERNGILKNQLTYLNEEGLLNAITPSLFSSLPNYKDSDLSLALRGRAYLESNCAHCHSDMGFASDKKLRLSYETSLGVSQISEFKTDIIEKMETGEMPKAGTTIIDEKGLELLKNYLNSL